MQPSRPVATVLVGILLVTASLPALASGNAGTGTDRLRTGAVAAGAEGIGPPTQSDGINYIHATTTMALTPSEPGEVEATITFELPENVGEFVVTPGTIGEVSAARGFTYEDGSYVWDGETTNPALELWVLANRSSARTPEVVQDGFAFVDVGRWAIVPVPSFGARWSWSGGGTVKLARSATTAGPGATGGDIAYLGDHATYTRTAHGQTFNLVVPSATAVPAGPQRVLDSVSAASDRLSVGERDSQVLLIAAPPGVEWGSQGLQVGESDAWVTADAGLETPENVWIHEYVHTRQDLDVTTETRWVTEATATYYAALITLETGAIDYDRFRRHLARGRDQAFRGAILEEPETWDSLYVPYRKGALVTGAIDRQLRVATDGGSTFDAVLARLNSATAADTETLLRILRNLGGKPVRDYGHRYVTTADIPETWSATEHAEAFDRGFRLRYTLADEAPVGIAGPYREATFATLPTLVPNETVSLQVVVENVGDAAGPFNATLWVNGSTVDSTAGTLQPGESRTVTVTHTFTDLGHYGLQVGETTLSATVMPPAELVIDNRHIDPTTVAVGEAVTLRADVSNPTDRPASGTVAFTVDGRSVTQREITLLPGETTTASTTVVFDDTGSHTVTIGGEQRSIEVVAEPTGTEDPGATPTDGRPTSPSAPGTGGTIPGFGAVAALLGFSLATYLAIRSR